ncbi:MAG: AAA family ATPase [Blastocatellia bacterium]|nr:AAA family ATPase [Blastocatellia bacterium]
MEGKRLIRSISLRNFLSYGDRVEEIRLEPLNVLIGRNASGKSNLIEAINLLHAAPTNFAAPIIEGGGISEWLWKGSKSAPFAEIEMIVDYPKGTMPLRYRIFFTMAGQKLEVIDEHIENESFTSEGENDPNNYFYTYNYGHPVIISRNILTDSPRIERPLHIADTGQGLSVLSQLKDPINYPEITYLGNTFREIQLFLAKHLGTDLGMRMPQDTTQPVDFLLPSGRNLALVLNDLQHRRTLRPIVERLKEFYSRVEDITTRTYGGTIQLFIHEQGLAQPIPAARLSDGTLRYLCLLTILCHPEPPPLLCIEEPELGLHLDILPTIAELLIEASQRTQLIVTTHSDVLVSALSDVPEAVLVCERDKEGTHLRRLEPDRLKEWLEEYSLGELWRMGEIGGN